MRSHSKAHSSVRGGQSPHSNSAAGAWQEHGLEQHKMCSHSTAHSPVGTDQNHGPEQHPVCSRLTDHSTG